MKLDPLHISIAMFTDAEIEMMDRADLSWLIKLAESSPLDADMPPTAPFDNTPDCDTKDLRRLAYLSRFACRTQFRAHKEELRQMARVTGSPK